MKIYPFYEVASSAETVTTMGAIVHQQFLCAGCGVKQTMAEPNKFYMTGTCEECGHTTDIEKDGCNYMVVHKFRSEKGN